jgi:hypothetical protein
MQLSSIGRRRKLACHLPYGVAWRASGMFRITRTDHRNHILVVIEGRLAGSDIGVAEAACNDVLSTDIPVTVLLKGVTEIDASGHAFLKRLARTKANLRALGIYSRYIVRKLRQAKNPQSRH